jgi:hypothetical protein
MLLLQNPRSGLSMLSFLSTPSLNFPIVSLYLPQSAKNSLRLCGKEKVPRSGKLNAIGHKNHKLHIEYVLCYFLRPIRMAQP